MGLTAEPYGADGKRNDQVQYGIDFLYKNRRDADSILFAARSANILLTLLFAFAVAWWTRRRYGPRRRPGRGRPLRVRPESDRARPLRDYRFPGHGIFLLRLRALGGVPGESHSAATARGRRGNRTGADHQVLGRAADSFRW